MTSPPAVVCLWCHGSHVIVECPRIPTRPIPPETLNVALAERVHRYRLMNGQLLRLCQEQHITIPQPILDMHPDLIVP